MPGTSTSSSRKATPIRAIGDQPAEQAGRQPQRDEHRDRRRAAAQTTCWTPGRPDRLVRQRRLDRGGGEDHDQADGRAAARPRRTPGGSWSSGPSSQAGPRSRGARSCRVRRAGRARARRRPAGAGCSWSRGQPRARDRVGEGAAAVGVVAEDVHRRGGRGEQHRVAGPGQRAPRRRRRASSSPRPSHQSRPSRSSSPLATVDHGDRRGVSRQRAAISARSRPSRTTPASRAATAATSGSTSAPLSRPPAIQTTRG